LSKDIRKCVVVPVSYRYYPILLLITILVIRG
jgi:hypothetical protein